MKLCRINFIKGEFMQHHHTQMRFFKKRIVNAVQLTLLAVPLSLAIPHLINTTQAAEQQASTARQYQIPAGSLSRVLSQFAAEAGIALSVDGALTEGRQSAGLQGRYTVNAGLSALLANTGLEFVTLSDGGYTLRKADLKSQPSSKAEQLPEVKISAAAEQESPTGPAKGYVAKRSLTATKTDTALIESPQSIAVVTRDQMNAQGVQSVSDALRYTAGVMAEANGPDPRADTISIRGFDATGRDQYRDGLRSYAFNNQGGTVVEPYGLERIEVLRGPSSILYGQGGPGGLINLVSKRPTDTPLHEMQLTLGSYDNKQLAGDFGGLLTEDGTWSYRLTGLVRDSQTQVDYVTDDRTFIAPALTWRPNDNTSLTILTDYQKVDRGQGYQAWPRIGTRYSSAYGKVSTSRFLGEPDLDKYKQERYSMGYQFEHIFNDTFTFRQNLRYQRMQTDSISTYLTGLQADQRTANRAVGGYDEHVENLALDNHLQAKWSHGVFEHTLLVGLDTQRMENSVRRTAGSAGTLDIYEPVYGATTINLVESAHFDQKLRQNGLYLQDQIKIDKAWVATLGGRKDWARMETDNLRNPAASSEQHDTAETWRAGLVYLASNGLAPYASYTESFLPVIGTSFSGAAFAPETGKQYEVGVRYQPQGSNSTMTVSLFDLRRQNVTTQDTNHANFQVQQGEVQSRGIEVEYKTTLDAVSLVSSYAYTLPEVTKSNNVTSQGIAIEGKDPKNVPRHVATLWADYRLPASILAGASISAGLRYIGSSYGDDGNTFKVPSYTLVDAAVHYDLAELSEQWKGWKFALNASNLFDKEYVATCGYSGDACKWGYRRNVLGTLTYSW
jgi:iron complex outermembrane receptor protein